ncbi:MAG TPA: hypothetical protein VF495_02490 [Phenylobacterium sp.]
MIARRIAESFAVAALALAQPALAATGPCPRVDAYGDFLKLAEASDAPGAFAEAFLPRYADLYSREAIGLTPGPALTKRATAALADGAGLAKGRETEAVLRRAIPMVTARFAKAFPDFRCSFTIYLAPTFGQMDGAGRQVGGRGGLVLGVDVIGQLETGPQLPVFLAHELFHRYHDQAAGFSDDLAARDLIWRTLWAEGLATYVSARLNPERPLADAMLLPRDLEARAAPLVPALAKELSAGLDRADGGLYRDFFLYDETRAAALGRPARSGYYLGYLVARKLAERHALAELPHLKGPALRAEIGAALAEMAAGNVGPKP